MHQREAVLHLYFYPTIFMLINVYAVIWRTNILTVSAEISDTETFPFLHRFIQNNFIRDDSISNSFTSDS